MQTVGQYRNHSLSLCVEASRSHQKRALPRQACSSYNSTLLICQIRYKNTNSGTVTLSSIVQYEGVCWARALIWRTTYFRSTVTHISVDDKYQAVENDNCFVVGWWPAWYFQWTVWTVDREYIHFRVAEVGSLSARAKIATKVIRRVFANVATNALFLCVIASLQI